jgi:ribosomal protein L9
MKIKFVEAPIGRPEYKKGDVVDFTGPVAEGYARKYIARGWAEPADKSAKEAAREDAERREADAKTRADADARQKAETDARLKGFGGSTGAPGTQRAT